MTKIKKPSVLIYDIETSPCLGWFWRSGKTVIGAHQIRRPGKIICLSYRFTHWKAGRVEHLKWSAKQSDEKMVKKFYDIAADADIIVGHNGDSFDKKWLNTRLAYYNVPTLKHTITEDTLKQTRKQFALPSFKLDFICKFFKIPGKLSTTTGMWERVLFDNCRKSLAEMVSYCDQDVLILDKLYHRIYPYVDHKINMAIYNNNPLACPECGGTNTHKRGFMYTRGGKFQRYQCTDCGNWFKDGRNLIKDSGKFRR